MISSSWSITTTILLNFFRHRILFNTKSHNGRYPSISCTALAHHIICDKNIIESKHVVVTSALVRVRYVSLGKTSVFNHSQVWAKSDLWRCRNLTWWCGPRGACYVGSNRASDLLFHSLCRVEYFAMPKMLHSNHGRHLCWGLQRTVWFIVLIFKRLVFTKDLINIFSFSTIILRSSRNLPRCQNCLTPVPHDVFQRMLPIASTK